jgi:hypothetical protein
MTRTIITFLGSLLLLGLPLVLPAQTKPQLVIAVTPDTILIGQPIRLSLKVYLPDKTTQFQWPAWPDTLPHFEWLDAPVLDTSNDNPPIYSQTLSLTSFDSGSWKLPALPVAYTLTNGQKGTLTTTPLNITVGYQADTTQTLRDIKPIIEVGEQKSWWQTGWLAAGILLFVVLLWLLIRWLKRKSRTTVPAKLPPADAYKEAMSAIRQLEQQPLDTAEQIRDYHTRLSELFRRYVHHTSSTRALQTTTGDLLVGLKSAGLSAPVLSELSAALRCGDAVKFARFLPDTAQSRECLMQVTHCITAMANKTTSP